MDTPTSAATVKTTKTTTTKTTTAANVTTTPPPPTTLGYALLGLLAREPLSGYDIAGQLEHGVGPFWHARHSQIYPELARLQAAGLVSHYVVEQRDRPAKKVFEVTAAGVDALHEWAAAPLHREPIRDELTLRAYSAWLADPDRAAAFFREQERLHREQLAAYEGYRAELEQGVVQERIADPLTPEFASFATLRRGIGFEREIADWCGWLADAYERASSAGNAG
jgi:DNA-binding PadR family transcriptional regulator